MFSHIIHTKYTINLSINDINLLIHVDIDTFFYVTNIFEDLVKPPSRTRGLLKSERNNKKNLTSYSKVFKFYLLLKHNHYIQNNHIRYNI